MKKDHLLQPFELVLRDPMDSCPRGEHAHSFFEMIYVVAGTGRQHVNEVSMPYHPGSLFLVAPGDVHLLEVETMSRILFIRFNPLFIQSSGSGQALRAQLEMILNNSRHEPGCLLKTESDKKYVPHLMNMLMDEHQKAHLYHRELINQLVNTLLIVVARNISQPLPTAMVETSELRIHDIYAIYKPTSTPRISCGPRSSASTFRSLKRTSAGILRNTPARRCSNTLPTID